MGGRNEEEGVRKREKWLAYIYTLRTRLIAGTITCDFCDRKCITLLNARFIIDILVYVV